MSSRRAGSAATPASRARSSGVQSGRLVASGIARLQDAMDTGHELRPRAALLLQHLLALGGHPVVAPAALPCLLDPAALNPAAMLESIEQRIERRRLEPHGAARTRLDQLRQLVPVQRAPREQREDEELGAPLLQLGVVLHGAVQYISVRHIAQLAVG